MYIFYLLDYQFIAKDIKGHEQSNEEIYRSWSRSVLNTGTPTPEASGVHHPPGMWMHSGLPAWKLSKPHSSEIFMETLLH